MADNVNEINEEQLEDIEIYEEEEFEASDDSVGFFTKAMQALSPRNVIAYILTRLWKPVLAFLLIFTLFLGSVYATAYYQLVNAKTALDFENTVAQLRYSTNPVIETVMPVIEWTATTLAAAGELMQAQIETHAEAVRRQQEEEALIAQQEEQANNRGQQEREAGAQRPAEESQQRPSNQQQERERQKQEDELQQIAEERQKELNKRAGKLAAYYAGMNAKDAVSIMQNLENDEIVVILNRMDNEAVSQILSEFEPSRASSISKDILNLHPTPMSIVPAGQGQGVL